MSDKDIDQKQWEQINELNIKIVRLDEKVDYIGQGVEEIKLSIKGLNGIKRDVNWNTWLIRGVIIALIGGTMGIIFWLPKFLLSLLK